MGSLGSAVSKDVCDEKESRMFVDARDEVRETVLRDLLDLISAAFGEFRALASLAGLARNGDSSCEEK